MENSALCSSTRLRRRERSNEFTGRALAVLLLLSSLAVSVRAQTTETAARHITLAEAVQLALKQNHVVRIAKLEIEEKQHAKEWRAADIFPA